MDEFELFRQRMQGRGVYPLVIETFRKQYESLRSGAEHLIHDQQIAPADGILTTAEIDPAAEEQGRARAANVAIIKLNGGLGTSMGLVGPKSLLKVRGELSFLDIIVRQSRLHEVPVLLMNSEATDPATDTALNRMAAGGGPVPRTFVQSMVPKIRRDDLTPVEWPADPRLEWCPPGHGDIYPSLYCSGVLEDLLSQDIRYAFVSNSDNLGATLDFSLLGHFIGSGAPFMMEVARRTEMDKKGGHLAKQGDRWLLRESAQCPASDKEKFQSVDLHSYFNTNNIWLDLVALRDRLREGPLELPLICNQKTVDPTDKSSTPIYQLETAMGSAIQVFAGATAVCVERTRFAPVKTTNELLLVRSDAYELQDDCHLVCRRRATINLDKNHYGLMDDFEARFPHGPPSLRNCTSLTIEGDFRFGGQVAVEGDVTLFNPDSEPVEIPPGQLLRGDLKARGGSLPELYNLP